MKLRINRWKEIIKHELVKVKKGCSLLYTDAKYTMVKKYNVTFYGEYYTLNDSIKFRKSFSDIFKMVPFSFFIIVPAAELLLPPTLYLFPNVIPSTFISREKEEKGMLQFISKRPQYADKISNHLMQQIQVLRSTVFEQSYDKQIKEVCRILRGNPHKITVEELMPYKKVFLKELNFGNMEEQTLLAACRFMIQDVYTGWKTINRLYFLLYKLFKTFGIHLKEELTAKRFPFTLIKRNIIFIQLRSHLKKIRNDDFKLMEEGIQHLDDWTVKFLCRERGIEEAENIETLKARLAK